MAALPKMEVWSGRANPVYIELIKDGVALTAAEMQLLRVPRVIWQGL